MHIHRDSEKFHAAFKFIPICTARPPNHDDTMPLRSTFAMQSEGVTGVQWAHTLSHHVVFPLHW